MTAVTRTHNNPPEILAPDPTELSSSIVNRFADKRSRTDELLKLNSKRSTFIKSDDKELAAAGFQQQLKDHAKELDRLREQEKAPYLEACRIVDAYFQGQIKPLDAAAKSVGDARSVWKRVKMAEAEAKARQEAERARIRAEELAAKAQTTAQIEAAADLEYQADRMEDKAPQRAKEMATTYSQDGLRSGVRKVWTYAIQDRAKIDLNQLATFLSADDLDRLLRAAVRAGVRQLDGVKIYEDVRAS